METDTLVLYSESRLARKSRDVLYQAFYGFWKWKCQKWLCQCSL